jgi:hypothetical protein
MRPRLLVELGVHSGNSYNAFCQAVSVLKATTKCYGVDTWQGDKQAGFYEEEVFNNLKRYQELEYGDFSVLLKMTFDEARDSFSDGTIDLLHIDGLHTYAAVKHDFENWLPKVSDRGVVIFHDTQERQEDFGVWRFWEEISPRYPAFEFTHGHGLGVIAVGSKMDKAVLDFLQSAKEGRSVQRLFYKLGNALLKEEELKGKEEEIGRFQGHVKDLESYIQTKEAEIGRFQGHVKDLESYIQTKEAEIGRFQEQVKNINSIILEKDQNISRLENTLREIYTSRGWKLITMFYQVKRQIPFFIKKG